MNKSSSQSEFLTLGTMLKARPQEEKGERFIYLEASREGFDQHNECVLVKALEESAPHFLKFGNIDIDHKSMPVVAANYGITDPESWEIGVPDDVRVDGKSILVKAKLYQGDTALATKANMVWDSMTKLSPAARWYASVGGATLAKAVGIDPATKNKGTFVTKVRWSNLAISRQPVNQHVASVSTIPFGVLAKCWTPNGFDLQKALATSYATDAIGKFGGAALGMQSLDRGVKSYFDFRDKLATAISNRDVTDYTSNSLLQYSANAFGLSYDDAAAWVERFIKDLKKSLKRG